jgi:hypothetical protein
MPLISLQRLSIGPSMPIHMTPPSNFDSEASDDPGAMGKLFSLFSPARIVFTLFALDLSRQSYSQKKAKKIFFDYFFFCERESGDPRKLISDS